MAQNTINKINTFCEEMIHEIRRCELRASEAQNNQDKPREEIYLNKSIGILNLLYRYKKLFEKELDKK